MHISETDNTTHKILFRIYIFIFFQCVWKRIEIALVMHVDGYTPIHMKVYKMCKHLSQIVVQ